MWLDNTWINLKVNFYITLDRVQVNNTLMCLKWNSHAQFKELDEQTEVITKGPKSVMGAKELDMETVPSEESRMSFAVLRL